MKKLLLFSFFCIGMHLHAYTEKDLLQKTTDISRLKEVLVMQQQWVPYPAYADRKGWDELFGDTKGFFIQQGVDRLNYEWKVVKATDYLEFERGGNRRVMEDPFGSNNQAIADLFMAELAEGKGRFIDPLINGVYQACEMTSWALSAHLGREQISGRSLPDNKKPVIDLTSGDLSSMLAWVYYYFKPSFDQVNPVIAERLRTELQERTMDAFMHDDSFWWMAFNYQPGMMVNNWNPWCNFNVLQTFFLLENDPDILAQAVYRTMVSVDQFINYTHTDGACEEGPSYWGHAAGKMYDYLQILYDGTGGKISIFDQPMIKAMGEYIAYSYVGDGWVVNFADASAKGGGGADLIFRYGKAVDSRVMKQYAAYQKQLTRQLPVSSGKDVFRTLQTLLYREELANETADYTPPLYTWYPETEFCYLTHANGFFLAAKGGYNNESHNHNDIGTFSLYLNKTPLFIDAGVGTYTRQTFSSERYSIWTMQSDYHNVPMINGVAQAFGAAYKATDVRFQPGRKTFSANIATAYPKEAHVKEWIRSYTLERNGVKIEDSFSLDQTKEPNQVNFLTWGKVELTKAGEFTVEAGGQKVKLIYDKEVFDPVVETITLDDARLSNVWGEAVYRVSLYAKQMKRKGKYSFLIQTTK
ncbi:heparinase II/III-family protein [Parabacteroides sp. PF5-6]|uniref:heparinase II/III family protein n=1 Tax=Parabacteroides sp. PF5-6 TaxID=1742403 RepID=UPI002405770C|nr:heparinase II/III-family protein [Parabacteroides sp. PF5-6]MDF9831146.1 DNA-binding phage protein [Parabacteroides sp. PF5-6]